MNPLESFRAAMRRAGLDYGGPIPADGRLHRFKTAGDGNKNSWFVLYAGPPMAGAFGCWRRNFRETWCEKSPKDYTAAQWREIQARWKQADIEHEQVDIIRREQARKTAAWIFDRAKVAQSHPYLEHKGTKIFGNVREYRGALVLPLRDTTGQLHSLQYIGADGGKKFLTGGRVAGCFFTLADKADGPLVICEGYATGASIHQATGHAVICAMNCGNMLAVSKAAREFWPQREIIIAADNDEWTAGNPGLTEARAAAKSIGAKLAVPTFKDTAKKPTDFNDLQTLEGFNPVKDQIEAAAVTIETDEETYVRLAKLSHPDYDRCRESEAERLKIRIGTLDGEVAKHRPASAENLQGSALNLADVELWPEAVNGAEVFTATAQAFSRFIALPDGAADALALWTAHTHCFEHFVHSPRLNISSPDKGCGKSTLLDVLAALVPRPLSTENLSVAVLFRVIEKHTPTVLADEYDSWLPENEELRGLFNAGHKRGGQALRCEGDGHEVRGFRVFAPAVLCGLGALPGTLHDRSIIIRLERAKPGELRMRFDSRRTESEQELCRKLARFCADNAARLKVCDPALPTGAFNRLADNWRPLFAIAEIAGGDWPTRAADAFVKLTSKEDVDAQGIGMMLLADIERIFAERHYDRIFSKNLVEALNAMTDRPWPEVHKGKPVSEPWLARRLRSFRISPRTLRIGEDRAKGYETADFADAFERYLPDRGQLSRDTRDNLVNTGVLSTLQSVTPENLVTGSNPAKTPENMELSRCHDSKPPAMEKPKELVEELI